MDKVTIIYVPTINDRMVDFRKIYDIYNKYISISGNFLIDFSECRFIRQNALSFLAAFIAIKKRQLHSKIAISRNCDSNLYSYLESSGFFFLFNRKPYRKSTNSIPVKFFTKIEEEEEVVSYLMTQWLKPQWVDCSDDLAGAIIGNIWEMFANSLEHSNSSVGLSVCGQHYPYKNELTLALTDLGVSIPGNVRRHLDRSDMLTEDAFRWAMTRGNSTRLHGPGGLGLDMLKEFITVNNAEMSIYSSDGYFRWHGRGEEFGIMPTIFRGTIINLTLKCDGRHYKLG
ncbi:hypothetical protein [Acetobacter senegalensis]